MSTADDRSKFFNFCSFYCQIWIQLTKKKNPNKQAKQNKTKQNIKKHQQQQQSKLVQTSQVIFFFHSLPKWEAGYLFHCFITVKRMMGRGVSWGRALGPRPPRVTKGASKRKGKEERKEKNRKEREKKKGKKGTKRKR